MSSEISSSVQFYNSHDDDPKLVTCLFPIGSELEVTKPFILYSYEDAGW